MLHVVLFSPLLYFLRHKKVDPQQTLIFMGAWAVSFTQLLDSYSKNPDFFFHFQNYALTMSKQLDSKRHVKGLGLGQVIKPEEIDLFTGEQLAQLFELYEETKKPQDEYPV